MKRVLYLTRNGLLEPLGQSQILSYLISLSKNYSFYIVSFEKEKDLKNTEHLERIHAICNYNNIVWKPLFYKSSNRKFNVLFGFLDLIKACFKIVRNDKVDFIHARSYFPSFIALLFYKLYNVPFIFDMRALWPEELVEAGRLKKNSLSWICIKYLEKKCLKKSKAVVSLTNVAVDFLDSLHPSFNLKEKTTVIPTCADLSRFKVKENLNENHNKIVLSCVGTVLSGWFKLNILKEVVHYYLGSYDNIEFEFLTRDDKEKLLSSLDVKDSFLDRLKISSVPFIDMPSEIQRHDGSVFFFTSNISKLGSAPTRMAELLGVGVPVLTNSGVGDVASIVENNKVGILIKSESKEDIHNACDEFLDLLKSKSIHAICRKTSEKLFSLESGVAKYKFIYSKI